MKQVAILLAGCMSAMCFAAGPTTQPDRGPSFFPPPADGHELRRIVFVCESSGSMLNCFPVVRRQLDAKLETLVGAQSFDVLFTGTHNPAELSSALIPVSDASRTKARQWIEDEGGRAGGSDMISAIEKAFALKPELIYLVDNGDYANNAAILRRIDYLNQAHAVRINTTAMIGDAKDTGWTETFQTIARQNGGVYTPIPFDASDVPAGIGGSIFALAPWQARAEKIVFLCDASGSILNKYATLRRQLSKAVGGLSPSHSFNLIFMQEADSLSQAPELLKATAENKRAADDLLENKVSPRGETNPIPAIDAAFAQKPDVIFLLTDGDFPDNMAVLKRIGELSAGRHVQINTIAFVNEADTDTDFSKLLQRIATDSGGVYRKVNERKVGI
jgi:hypothetical protein